MGKKPVTIETYHVLGYIMGMIQPKLKVDIVGKKYTLKNC